MASNIVLNKTNIINLNKGNNRLRYDFPTTIQIPKGSTIAMSGFHIYYSWFNISAANNNNFFQYKWFNNTNGDVTEIFDVVISDGYYSISTLYEYFQKVMVSNGHYLELIEGGNFIYFIEFLTNSTYYSSEIRLSTVSNTYNFGFGDEPITDKVKTPTGWVIPDTFKAPEIIIPSNNRFGELLGFKSGTISTPNENIQYQYSYLNNNGSPNLEPTSSILITCNMIDNPYGVPSNILTSIAIPDTPFGSQISSVGTDDVFSKIKEGTYRSLSIDLYNQDFVPLKVIDPNLLIVLSLKIKEEEEE